jgi:hypothetical protein
MVNGYLNLPQTNCKNTDKMWPKLYYIMLYIPEYYHKNGGIYEFNNLYFCLSFIGFC